MLLWGYMYTYMNCHSNTYTGRTINARPQDRNLSSKSRSASLGRCKTWTLDWTHELTDIWTPDKAINDDMTHMPCIQPCLSSSVYQWRIWRLSKIVAVCRAVDKFFCLRVLDLKGQRSLNTWVWSNLDCIDHWASKFIKMTRLRSSIPTR